MEFSLKCLLIELESIEYWNLRQHFQTQAHLWSLLKSGLYFLIYLFLTQIFQETIRNCKVKCVKSFSFRNIKTLKFGEKTGGYISFSDSSHLLKSISDLRQRNLLSSFSNLKRCAFSNLPN